MSVSALIARAGAWLIEPAEEEPAASLSPAAARPVVAVFGLGRACGATVVARALAVELAARDPSGAAAVCDEGVPAPRRAGAARGPLPTLGSAAAGRLARTLRDLPRAGTRSAGRLCLVEGAEVLALADTCRHHAPLVLDAGSDAIGGTPAALADHVVLVASPRLEPALAPVAAACLARVGPDPIVVLNRAREAERWEGHAHVAVPESRVAAQLALVGREAAGDFGRAARELADAVEGA